ncbi:small ribosomal subunit biogenesis GTPase RsgA [Reinekea blandensis]|uniref:Small ribosomal subunit biogenesis GTPase RsgA n=1 Tax=Reinekea blandensis MED297 TaxID=314283 RepID=A4BJC5_9GAMM|nr:small ribosomal subunit biogenesis GTPase RsgA [Reinekea blandensis]EAR07783.1 ribosome small subunit-dependent GTPase A [Reinekea sp. MED297] [Reinekea blandensis MED297]
MSKRKLSRQQQFRIDRIQRERLERAQKKDRKADEKLNDGGLSDPESGLIIAHYGATIDVESQSGEVYRCHVRSNLPALVTGDQVIWHRDDDGTGVISAVEPRRSILTRPDTRGRLRPVAANVDRIILVVSPAPRTPANLIDRYLVATAHDDILPIILLNKQDLLDQAPEMATELEQYEALGYSTVRASAKEDKGLETIQSLVKTGNSVFVGQSGVGKSSIIDRLLPDEDLKVGQISESTGKGRHTTTTARLYHIPTGGQLIDSPGIREFGLWHTAPEDLDKGFPEIYRFAGTCKFRDCTHTHEPGCRVKQAVEEGDILARRLDSFLSIRDSVDEVTIREL